MLIRYYFLKVLILLHQNLQTLATIHTYLSLDTKDIHNNAQVEDLDCIPEYRDFSPAKIGCWPNTVNFKRYNASKYAKMTVLLVWLFVVRILTSFKMNKLSLAPDSFLVEKQS